MVLVRAVVGEVRLARMEDAARDAVQRSYEVVFGEVARRDNIFKSGRRFRCALQQILDERGAATACRRSGRVPCVLLEHDPAADAVRDGDDVAVLTFTDAFGADDIGELRTEALRDRDE